MSVQQTKNLFQELVDEGKEKYVLQQFMGANLLSSVGGKDRGFTVMLGIPYWVAGKKLYSFNSAGVATELGVISGSDRCILSNDGVNVIVVSNAGVYKYDGSSVSTVTDSNIVGSESVTFLNSQMIYTKPRLGTIADPNQPDVASGLNSFAAESKPDDLVAAYAFQQNAYMMGTVSCEPWWNTGEGNPPLARIDGQIFEVGCASKYSIANTDEFMYWLGDDHSIYRATGGAKDRISSSAISNAIEKYTTIDDAIGQAFTFQGLNFYMITFPTENKTWCINESLGSRGWFELSSGTNDGKYQMTSIVGAYGGLYAMDDGNIYKLDANTYTNGADLIQRRRVTSSISGKLMNATGKRMQMSRFELIMEKGDTVVTGQGEDPKIQFEVSYDGGRSWKPKGWGRIGRLGEFIIKVEMFNLDTFYDCIVRMTTTDPAKYTLYSASADLRLAGY
ncbi:MAG: hypothetical protein ACPGUE_21610 [Marinomonas sp.]